MAAAGASPFGAREDGVAVAVKVTPKSSRNTVTGLAEDADGRQRLAVAVSAPPEGGKANAALVKLLAREWRVAKSTITVMSGGASRRKSLHVAGDSRRLLLDLRAWLSDIVRGCGANGGNSR